MTCAECSHANPETARFCNACGAPLAPRCPGCGAGNPPGSRFCNACGAALAARPEPVLGRVEGAGRRADPSDRAEARKIVTIVFADLIGSTSLHERLDPESVSRVMDRYHRAVRAPVEAHGGTVVQLLGDGVMCAFGVPRVAEDDAIRAVRAAVGIQRAFREFAREERAVVGPVGLRVAVNTGEVVVSDLYTAGIGDPLNVAARLQQEAHDGDVLIGEPTRRLVSELVTLEPFGVLALKGRSETVATYRVVSLERPGGASAVAFVGREEELGRLGAVYDAARAAPAARLAVVLGSPGVGKSRLLDEFARRLDGATVLVAHCEAVGGATFAPIARALRTVLGVGAGPGGYDLRAAIEAAVPGSEADRSRIAAGIGALLAGTPAAPEETFFVVRRLLAGLGASQPVVLVLDDLQWAAPLLLDLLEHLVQWSTGVPLLLLAAARPDLREARSALVAPGRVAADVVTLGGLDAVAATRLAANVLGADALPAAVAGRVLATSEGNPLFLGELVRMLVDDGALKRQGDRWTAGVDLAALAIPPTIHALLAARIERLRAEDRLVLERAAIVGRQFSRAAVAHLLPPEAQGDLDARVEALRRSELIEPDTGWFLGEPALRFHHGLIRDAAYRRVLKGTRAELHARVAEWIESRVGEAVEHDETIGWHLEQAHRHLQELGPIDDRGRALGDRAARYLAAAGRRALARDDLPLAASLLGRALARLDGADPARAELALDWCEALLEAGDVGPAAQALDELGRFTEGSARLRAWHTCFVAQRAVLTDPQTLQATVDAVAAAAAELAAVGDGAGEAKAHAVHARALARLGQVGACEAALDKALAAARRAHDRRRSNAVLAGAPLAALWGPSPVTRASGRCLDVVRVLRITQGAPAVEAVALRCQAVLEALRGRAEAARRMIASSRHMIEELGITHQLLETDVFTGLIDLLEDDPAAAERGLRGAYEGLRSQGLGIDAARAAAFLGRALLAQGRVAEAEALSRDGELLAGDDLEAAIRWRGVRAEALARRGEHAAAIECARAAVDLAAATDALLHHADARRALAAALRAAGRHDEAAAEEKQATALWEAKGATVLAERARRDGGRVPPADRAPDARGEPASRVRRRVPPNAAMAHAVRLEAAMAARDPDALAGLYTDELEIIDHTTGTTHDRQGELTTWQGLLNAEDGRYRSEPLATLGDSLLLCRASTSASGFVGRKVDVGAYEKELIGLLEVDAEGRQRRCELFAPDRLGDAVVRLYERYADGFPDGPERTRAATTARAIAALLGPADRWLLAADVEAMDHRTVGFGSLRGAEAVVSALRALLELTADYTIRIDDILALRPDALVIRWTNLGTDRHGGAFERRLCQLFVFGADGLVTRWEQFDADRDAEALARFDELTAEPSAVRFAAAPSRVATRRERRVRANAATANAARVDAAIAARDVDAFPTLWADQSEAVAHETGTTWDRQGSLVGWRSLLRTRNPTSRHQPLATLGDSLALCCWSTSASGFAGRTFDVGAYEREEITLVEVDAQGRRRRTEAFAVARLGDAVVRLYERYAELLPDGPERDRATATARSVAALPLVGSHTLDLFDAQTFAPAFEYVDHRTVGMGSLHGAEALRRAVSALLDLMEDSTARTDDVLALRPDAFLVRWTHFGTDRAGGGAIERRLCHLWVFGADGLVTRGEQFDAEQGAAALTRFDELTAEPPPVRRRVRANAATAAAARADAAIAARDVDAFLATWVEGCEVIDHPTGATYGLRELGDTWRLALLWSPDLTQSSEEMATLGDALGLFRNWFRAGASAGGRFDVGAYEIGQVFLNEVDEQGRGRRSERFAVDRLGDAVVRLYERYAELLPDGPERTRAATTARAAAAFVGRVDFDRWAAAIAPDIEAADHRTLGIGSPRGAKAFLRGLDSLLEVADDVTNRVDDVLALRSDTCLLRVTNFGTDRAGGGAYERPSLVVCAFGADGLLTRLEQFDVGHEAEALTRLDELAAELPATRPVRRRVRANAATAHAARVDAAIAARDADALPALFADELKVVDHTTGVDFDRQGALVTWRVLLKAENPALASEPLATLGDSLVLCRLSTSASGFVGRTFDVGAYEQVEIALIEVDAQGRERQRERFAVDRLSDAVVRLFERYAELLPDGPERARGAATARAVAVYVGPEDLDRYAATLAPHIDYVDHRIIAMESTKGAEAFLRVLRSLHEVGDDVANRVDDVLALRPDAGLLRVTNFGMDRAGAGAYERPFLALSVFGADGRLARFEQFDVGHEAEALARFDELCPGDAGETTGSRAVRFENAATRAFGRGLEALQARDWERFAALMAPGFRGIDRRTMLRNELDRDEWHASYRSIVEMTSRTTSEVLATRGARLMLARFGWEGTDDLVGPSEIEYLLLIEVDGRGDHVAVVMFDPDALDAAYTELDARYVAGEAAHHARTWEAWLRAVRAIATRDWTQLAAVFAPGFVVEDHRPIRLLASLSGDEYVASARALVDLRPDVRFRVDHALALDDGGSLIVGGWVGGEPDGTFEIRAVVVTEHGPDGIRRWHVYNLDQLGAARACYDALTAKISSPRIENAATRLGNRFVVAWVARDWEGLASLFAPGFRLTDRRSYAHLDLDLDQHLESLRFRFEMRSSRTTLEILATRGHRLALMRQRFELADGDVGPSETESLIVAESDEHAHFAALVTFDLDDLDAAYAELDRRWAAGEAAAERPDTARDPLAALAKPNPASAARDRAEAAFEARDWPVMRAMCAPDAKFEDRRRHVLVSGGIDEFIADRQRWARAGFHQERRLVATTGDRVALERVLATSGPPDGRSEFECLRLTEVDERGRILATVAFDLDDWRAANAELVARALAHDAAAASLRPIYEFVLGLNDHELARMRTALADDLVVQDHRLAGLGLVDGADAYLESVAALWRLVPDDHIEASFELARERHGVVFAGGSVGTLPEGGTFERPMVIVSIVAGGRVTRMEFFEPEDADAALARFAELRPDPLRIPPNAATRANDRGWECIERRDWEALQALCAPIVWEDRRRLIRTIGDCDTLIANAKLISRSGTRVARTTLATAGDRLMLQRSSYSGPPEGPSHEIENLELVEVDAEGRVIALIDFDPDDRRAASAEMLDRHARSDATQCIPAAVFEAYRAFNDHDLDRFRATLHDDFVFRDHRRTGVGTLERTDYLASIRPLFEAAPDLLSDELYYIATEKHGSLSIGRDSGTLRDGGECESVYARIMLYQDERIVAMEQYELEHLDVARARFEELRP